MEVIMAEVSVDIRLPADEYLRFYKGSAKSILVKSREGIRVKFPAELLRPYVTIDGIFGAFIISFDSANKIKGIRKM